MEQEKVPEQVEETLTVEQVLVELQKLATKYNTDMNTLNRILSTYEDEISSLKSQYHDLSFKLKQLTQKGE